jgi:hypothetical protein
MTRSSSLFQSTRLSASPHKVPLYTHPHDVTTHPKRTTAEKRAILASWISDAGAVENAPSLRRLDSGAVVELDVILHALVLLDQLAPDSTGDNKRPPPLGSRHGVISRWLRGSGSSPGANDNDDDPPPAPAGVGIPFRPKPLSPARGACLGRARDLACAIG